LAVIVSADRWEGLMAPLGLQGRRIAIIGNSGSGKSTLARDLSQRLGIAHIELDALNWRPGWYALSTEAPDEWARVVGEAIVGDEWITDGNYSQRALPQILPRASDLIWLDYSRAVIMTRVIRRSLLRAISGGELWAGTGNREEFRRWLDKDHPIRWTWDTYRSANKRREARFADPGLAHARKHRFRTPAETRRWLAEAVGACVTPPPVA
jgi:adenylate kinase family enzyme